MTPAIETSLSIREHDVRAEDFLPVLSVPQAVERKNQINQFIGQVLVSDLDYGLIPGSKKKCLLKPGAEKLCSIFGLAPSYVKEVIVEDWTGADHESEPLFSYEYRCQLYRGGRFMGEAIGSCNSWESKYRYRWMPEDAVKDREDFEYLPKRGGTKTLFEPSFALDKAETTGKYGKPAEYWEKWRAAAEAGEAKPGKKLMGGKEYQGYYLTVDETQYRIPNPEVADIINTCQKMAQKRALVAACLVVTNCSDAFTQDLEDFEQPQAHPVVVQSAPERPVPQELAQTIADIKADPKRIKYALSTMENHLVACGGSDGLAEYNRLATAFRVAVPRGKQTHANIRDLLLDMWEAAEKMRPAAEPAPVDEDVPF